MKICFAGKQRSGKDTAAEYFVNKYGGEIIKFASPLYEMQEAIYKIAGLKHSATTKDRALLQYLGTDWGRKTIDPDIWINLMDERLTHQGKIYDTMKEHSIFHEYTQPHIFITDARFLNEIEVLDKHGFVFIGIDCEESIRVSRGATNLTHESETALDNFSDYDYIVSNNTTLEDYYKQLDNIYENIANTGANLSRT